MRISVIYSCKDETENPFFYANLEQFAGIREQCEIIFVDGSASLQTSQELHTRGFKVLSAPNSNRAARYNIGAKASSGDIILFHHPRSTLARDFLQELKTLNNRNTWGAFTHIFDKRGLGYAFTSWYSNHIRGDISHIYYADHCIFCSRDLFDQVNGFPEVDIFEDTLFCYRLRKLNKPIRLQGLATTSSIRFTRNGFLRQAWLNQKLKLQFYFQFKDSIMNQNYEKNLNLNEDVDLKNRKGFHG